MTVNYHGETLKRRRWLTFSREGRIQATLRHEFRYHPLRLLGISAGTVAAAGLAGILALSQIKDWAVEHHYNLPFSLKQKSLEALDGISKNRFDSVVAEPWRENIMNNLSRQYPNRLGTLSTSRVTIDDLAKELRDDKQIPQKGPVTSLSAPITYRSENIGSEVLARYKKGLEAMGYDFSNMNMAKYSSDNFVRFVYMPERLKLLKKDNVDIYPVDFPAFYTATENAATAKLSVALQIPLSDLPTFIYLNRLAQQVQERRSKAEEKDMSLALRAMIYDAHMADLQKTHPLSSLSPDTKQPYLPKTR